MNFSLRELKIINLLQSGSYDSEKLATQLAITSKTLKADINHINLALKEYESAIVIENKQIKFESIYPPVHWKNIVRLNIVVSEEDLILLRVLEKFEYIPMVELANELYMSKSKLEKVIATSPKLNEYVSRKRNVGIGVDLDFKQRINISASLLLPYIDDLNYLVTARAVINQVTDKQISVEQFQKYIRVFNAIISQIGNATDYECKLTIVIVILSLHVYKQDQQFTQKLITEYINHDSSDERLRYVVELTIRTIFADNNINISNDKLLQFCINHIEGAISNKLSSTISQDMELAIKSEFSFAYNIASQILTGIERELSTDFGQSEICYVAMYVQSLIRNDEAVRFKVLLVCQYGMSVSNYIQVWIEQNIKLPIDFTISSILNYNTNIKSNDYNLILTTIDNLEATTNNVLYLSSIPLPNELSEAKAKIIKAYNDALANSFFAINTIHRLQIDNIEQIYAKIESDFSGSNKEFIEKMAKRTRQGLTNVNGVIILHSDGTLITDNRMLIYKLDKPIVVDGEVVKMIFVFAFTAEFIKQYNNIIKQIYRVLYSDQYVSALYETTSDNQFMWIFRNQIRNR